NEKTKINIRKRENSMSLDNTVEKIINGNQKSFKRIQLHQSIEVSGTKQGEILSFYIKNEKGQEVMVLPTEQSYTFGMLVKFNENIDNVLFGFEMENVRGVKLFSVNNFLTNEVLQNVKVGELYEVSFELRLPRICTGEYLVSPSLAAGSQDSHVVLERIHNYLKITIDNDGYNLSIIDLDTKCLLYTTDAADEKRGEDHRRRHTNKKKKKRKEERGE
ncbi:hypothetical protein CG709_09695, partial [Lachnotalea glycerini]